MRLRPLFAGTLAVATIAAFGSSSAAAPVAVTSLTTQSVAPDGSAGNGNSEVSLVSADGARVVFMSTATNLIAGFTANSIGANVWSRDTSSGTTTLLSRSAADPRGGVDTGVILDSIDASGRFAVFRTDATNLVSGFSNSGAGTVHLYLADVDAGTATLVDHVSGSASIAGDANVENSILSDDGSTVVFTSSSTNLIAGVTSIGAQVFAYDIASASLRLVSHAASDPLVSGDSDAYATDLSADGTSITYWSHADNLVPGFTPAVEAQAYVEIDGTTTLVSRANGSPTTGANGISADSTISADGSRIALLSDATDLVAGVIDTNGDSDVYAVDTDDFSTRLVSHNVSSTTTTGNAYTRGHSISADGSRLAMYSTASDLVTDFVDNSGGGENAYVADLDVDSITLLSRGVGVGNQGSDHATDPAAISRDGRVVALRTASDNLGWSSNGHAQVAIAVVDTGELILVSRNAAGGGANFQSVLAAGTTSNSGILSTTGRYLAMNSAASDLAANPPVDGAFPQTFLAELEVRSGHGYWLIARDGGVFSFGDASFYGSTGALTLNQPIVGGSSTPSGNGYWFTASDGGVFSFGDAQFSGSTGALTLNQPVVGMIPVPWSSDSYWLVARDGGVFSFGPDAEFFGSTGALTLNQPIVGGAATPSGNGYWFVAADGGVFSFGDARFHGSTGDLSLNQPIVAIAPTPSGRGYWLIARDGGVFSFGDADFYGSTGALTLNQPIVGALATPTGLGYWFVAADGGIFSFGDADFYGSTGALTLNQPIVGMTGS